MRQRSLRSLFPKKVAAPAVAKKDSKRGRSDRTERSAYEIVTETIENQADAVLKGYTTKEAWKYYGIPSRSTWDQDARIASAVMGWAMPSYPDHQSRGKAKQAKWLAYREFLKTPKGSLQIVLEALKTIKYGSFFQERMKEGFESAIAFLDENVENNFETAIRYYEANGKKYQRPQH